MQADQKCADRPKNVWKPYKFRRDLKLLKQIRTGRIETRGHNEKYDDEALIAIYVEVESLARLQTGGKIHPLLNSVYTRIFRKERWVRLDRKERLRIRKLYDLGKREALHWKETVFVGRPHPNWAAIQRRIEGRMDELRAEKDRLFFLKKM